MIMIDWKARIKNKTWWIATISALLILSQQLGLNMENYIPKNYVDIINTLFIILTLLGVSVDTSTTGMNDYVDKTSITK